MQNPRLATRYAKSLIGLSVEKGQLENVFADMLWLQSVCKTNKDFVTMLKSPIIKSDKKQKIIEAMRIHYNYVREHSILGKTPAEQSGIRLPLGENKIESLIRLARVKK